MSSEASIIVQRLWNYCNVLRDDGVSYGDYVEQLTYLLFLKMADEQLKPSINKLPIIPKSLDWNSLLSKKGYSLKKQYLTILETLAKKKGMLGVIFKGSQNKIQDSEKLRRLIELIDDETWREVDIDVKGDIYEGLLQKNAEDIKSGAGQYFTPRPLIQAVVEVIKPRPMETICDPACGTGGFLLVAHEFISKHYSLNQKQEKSLKFKTFKGWEIVDNAARLCVMNLYLHGIGGEESPIVVSDALAEYPEERFDIVLTNPPFGKKGSYTIVNGNGKIDKESQIYERQDFWATTSNKQLNFLQHVKTLLKINGKAAIIVPDNVLFEGGAGEIIRRKLLQECDVHTLLRLPTGVFYAHGVKANVLFFDRKPASKRPLTKKVWIYDLRTNMHFTLKTNTLKYEDLEDFISCYNPDDRFDRKETERFRAFAYNELMKRDKVSLDIFWLKDEGIEDTKNFLEPNLIAKDITKNLEFALEQFSSVQEYLKIR